MKMKKGRKLLTPSNQAEEWGFPQSTLFIIYTLTMYIYLYISLLFLFQTLSLAPHSLFLDSQHQSLQLTGRGLASLDPPHLSYHVYKYLSLFTLLAFKLSPCRHLHSQRKSLSSRLALLAGQGSCFARPATFLLPCISLFSSARRCGRATLPPFSSARPCGHATIPPFFLL